MSTQQVFTQLEDIASGFCQKGPCPTYGLFRTFLEEFLHFFMKVNQKKRKEKLVFGDGSVLTNKKRKEGKTKIRNIRSNNFGEQKKVESYLFSR